MLDPTQAAWTPLTSIATPDCAVVCIVTTVKCGATAAAAANEYGRRFGCEEGFRDAKWWLGFTQARIAQIKAWSRMFALFAMALLVMTSLGSKLLLAQGHRAKDLLRRVVSRRRGRCELGLVSAMVSLLQRDKTLYNDLCPHVKLKLEATLENVS